MDRLQSRVAARPAALVAQPGEGARHHPAVPAEARRALDALAGDAAADAPPVQVAPAVAHVVALVGAEVRGARAPPAIGLLDRLDALHQRREDRRVGARRPGQPGGAGEALRAGDEVVLRAGLGAIRRGLAGRQAPLFTSVSGSTTRTTPSLRFRSAVPVGHQVRFFWYELPASRKISAIVRALGAGKSARRTARSSVLKDQVAIPATLRSGWRWASATTRGPRPGAIATAASPRALKRLTSAWTVLPPA